MRGAPGKKPRHGRRWGSKAEPYRSERSRRVRGAAVAPYGPVPARTPSTMIGAGKTIDHEPIAFEHGLNSLRLA
jgi:hypothetical protein